MKKQWNKRLLCLAVALCFCPSFAACSASDGESTGGGLFGIGSTEDTGVAVGTLTEYGVYMGTVEDYQNTFDTLFDENGYRVVAVGGNSSEAGIVDAKYGVIDMYGNFIVEPIYDEIVFDYYTEAETPGGDVLPDVFFGGYLQVVRDGKMGLVDTTGTEVIPCEYSFVAMPSEGICTLYNRREGASSVDENCSYVGYWNLALGKEILSPSIYYCFLENYPIGNSDSVSVHSLTEKPEGDYYCMNDFINGYAVVVVDPNYEIPDNANISNTEVINMDYVNLIDTEGNLLYDQSYLTRWSTGTAFSEYPQHGPYLYFWEAENYSGKTYTNANGATVSLSVSTVYETGVMGPDGVVLPADYTGGVVASLNGVDYSVASVIPYLSIEDNIIIIEQDTTPDVMNESEVMYYDLTGQPTAAQEIPSNDTAEYRIVQQNDLNGVQAADGTMTVDYQYRYIKEGVEGSTWYVCQNSERKYGLVDITTGEEILPCMYDQVGFVLGDGQSNVNNFEMGVCYVILDGREYLVNADNEVVAEVTGYGLSEATNGLYFSQTYYAYVDNEGKLVLPGYLDTRELDDPYSSYTLYQKDGAVYQISANYLINAEDISTYGQSTAVYMPDFTLALTTIDTSAAAQFYLQGDSFDATGIVVLHSMVCTGAPVDVAAEVSYAIGEEPLAVGDALDTQGVCTVRVLYEDVEIGTFEFEVLDSAVDYILPGDYYIVSGDFYVSEYIYRESSYYYVLGTADDCSVFTVTWQGGDDYTIQAKDSGNYIGNSFMGQLEGVTSSQPVWTLTKSGSSYTMTTANWPDMVVTPNWDEGVGAWIYLQSAEDATAANTQLQFVPVA